MRRRRSARHELCTAGSQWTLTAITKSQAARTRGTCQRGTMGDAWLAGGTWLFSEPQLNVNRADRYCQSRLPALETTSKVCVSPRASKIAAAVGLISAAARFWRHSKSGTWRPSRQSLHVLAAGPMISLTTALDGVCTIWTPEGNERRVAVADFVFGAASQRAQAGGSCFGRSTCRRRRCADARPSAKSR